MSRRLNITSKSTVDKEVTNLFNLKDKSQYSHALLSLHQKYKDDDLVNRIQEIFIKKQRTIIIGAKKFAEAFRKRYGTSDMPYHLLLSKARTHAKKHHIDEAIFIEFQRMYEQELVGANKTSEVVIPITNLMKVLGNINSNIEGELIINKSDNSNLQNIITEWKQSKQLHAQTLIQGLQYTDLHKVALSGIIDKTEHNPAEHIHPVIAAMFLPKIELFESHFLQSNIGSIVNSRYNQETLTTRPDYELFYNMVTDPNDVVCDNHTPIVDLLNRSRLQQHLWNSVLHLRNGQYYGTSFNEFIRSVDNCKLNKYDNPDFTYGRHDGTIIKRLLSAFSFRPTVIATLPVSQVFSMNPYSQNIRPTVTSIPMINVRLNAYQDKPITVGSTAISGNPRNPVKLSKCLTQQQTFIEGNTLIQRISDVIYSRQVLIFYIDRRAHVLKFGHPFNITRLPTAIAGFERINTHPVDLECKITVKPESNRPDTYCLRSVVVAEIQPSDVNTRDSRSIVIGSSSFIYDYDYNYDKNEIKSTSDIFTWNKDLINNEQKFITDIINILDKNNTDYKRINIESHLKNIFDNLASLKNVVNINEIKKVLANIEPISVLSNLFKGGAAVAVAEGEETPVGEETPTANITPGFFNSLSGFITKAKTIITSPLSIFSSSSPSPVHTTSLADTSSPLLVASTSLVPITSLVPSTSLELSDVDDHMIKLNNLKLRLNVLLNNVKKETEEQQPVLEKIHSKGYIVPTGLSGDLLDTQQTELNQISVLAETIRSNGQNLSNEYNNLVMVNYEIRNLRPNRNKISQDDFNKLENNLREKNILFHKVNESMNVLSAMSNEFNNVYIQKLADVTKTAIKTNAITAEQGLTINNDLQFLDINNEKQNIINSLITYIMSIMVPNPDSAKHIYHYDPGKALNKHSPYSVYDVLTKTSIINKDTHIIPGVQLIDALNKDQCDKMICEQGIIFIYQNFKYGVKNRI